MQYSQYSSTNKQLHLLQLISLFLLSALLVEVGEGTIEFPELDPLNNIMFSKLFSQFNLKYHKMIFSMVNFIKDVQVSIVQNLSNINFPNQDQTIYIYIYIYLISLIAEHD